MPISTTFCDVGLELKNGTKDALRHESYNDFLFVSQDNSVFCGTTVIFLIYLMAYD